MLCRVLLLALVWTACCWTVDVVDAKAVAAFPSSLPQVHIVASSRYDYGSTGGSSSSSSSSSGGGDDDDGNSGSDSVGSDGAGPQKSKGIQIMVTQRMRRVLEDELGYTTDEVDAMEPQIAAVVIERGLARPAAGMPKSWRKKRTWPPIVRSDVLAGMKKRVTTAWRKLKGPATFVARKVAPVVLVGGAALLALPRALDLLAVGGASALGGLKSAASIRLPAPKLPSLPAVRQQPASKSAPAADERPPAPARAPAKVAAVAAPKPSSAAAAASAAATSPSDASKPPTDAGRVDMKALNSVLSRNWGGK